MAYRILKHGLSLDGINAVLGLLVVLKNQKKIFIFHFLKTVFEAKLLVFQGVKVLKMVRCQFQNDVKEIQQQK